MQTPILITILDLLDIEKLNTRIVSIGTLDIYVNSPTSMSQKTELKYTLWIIVCAGESKSKKNVGA